MKAKIKLPITTTDPEMLREALAKHVCPWCPSGPFQLPLIHINYAHGVTAREFKDMAGLTYTTTFCSEELKNRLAELAVNQFHESPEKFTKFRRMRASAAAKMSSAARKMISERAKQNKYGERLCSLITNEQKSKGSRTRWAAIKVRMESDPVYAAKILSIRSECGRKMNAVRWAAK